MSHYSVAVFADDGDFDRLLDPYGEERHLTRHLADEKELRERYAKFLEQNPSWEKEGFEYWLEQFGYKREGDEIASYYNDNAKWDYYSLDGRNCLFDLKPEAAEDEDIYEYHKNDYDYDTPSEDWNPKHSARFWEVVVEGRPLRKGEAEPFSLYNKEYYLSRYKTKERYVAAGKKTIPYAFITPDGVWHSPGTVGWFAVDDATAESLDAYEKEWEDWIASPANPYVNFVDCHI